MTNLFNLIISLFATTLGAISGVGGGIIIKPVYDALSGLDVATINFMSGCTVLSMSIVSLIKSRNSGVKLDKIKSTTLALGAAVGGVLGKSILEEAERCGLTVDIKVPNPETPSMTMALENYIKENN